MKNFDRGLHDAKCLPTLWNSHQSVYLDTPEIPNPWNEEGVVL